MSLLTTLVTIAQEQDAIISDELNHASIIDGVRLAKTRKERFRNRDLVFWKGHMAIVRDSTSLVHCNAFHMAVAVEPTAAAIARIAASDGPASSFKHFAVGP